MDNTQLKLIIAVDIYKKYMEKAKYVANNHWYTLTDILSPNSK